MPVGKVFINEVAAVLTNVPSTSSEIRFRLAGSYSSRAVRYALAALVKDGRAKRHNYGGGYTAAQPEIVTEGV